MDLNRIQSFLSDLDKSRRRLTGEEMEVLYGLAAHPDPLVRSDVAALLVDHYEEKSEEALFKLSFDSDHLVRTDAVDSLCIGRKETVLQSLLFLVDHDPEYTVRRYAVHSAYDVFLNMFGDSDNTFKVIRNLLTPLLEKEEDKWVRTCYYDVLYLSGDENYLQCLIDCLDDEDYYVRNSVLTAFEDIMNEKNEAAIEDALQYNLPFEAEQTLSEKMEEILLLIEENKEERLW